MNTCNGNELIENAYFPPPSSGSSYNNPTTAATSSSGEFINPMNFDDQQIKMNIKAPSSSQSESSSSADSSSSNGNCAAEYLTTTNIIPLTSSSQCQTAKTITVLLLLCSVIALVVQGDYVNNFHYNSEDSKCSEQYASVTSYLSGACLNFLTVTCHYSNNSILFSYYSDENCKSYSSSFSVYFNECAASDIYNCSKEFYAPPISYSELEFSTNCAEKVPITVYTTPLDVCYGLGVPEDVWYYSTCNSSYITTYGYNVTSSEILNNDYDQYTEFYINDNNDYHPTNGKYDPLCRNQYYGNTQYIPIAETTQCQPNGIPLFICNE
ncbi:hypothetical protein DLAC_09328 [Tieghemostelium lacteum]|uniref:Uncharacterized protein n=1 Tax=Tieghemostelium lacteum TaxID=361077 RepID=A0A151Z9U3_TIELA|nr:hypothetical protein DLAC_09328 [Tieghemostelium lacteum]|eukprot:KYQ90695.1 hypothetical protein DLAC_09328 [Tieghemostelium lacteum]